MAKKATSTKRSSTKDTRGVPRAPKNISDPMIRQLIDSMYAMNTAMPGMPSGVAPTPDMLMGSGNMGKTMRKAKRDAKGGAVRRMRNRGK